MPSLGRLLASLVLLAAPLVAAAAPAGPQVPPAILAPPPTGGGPVLVEARFDLADLNRLDEENEIFEFAGTLTVTWNDPRQAFDPKVEGTAEKIFQGAFQFDEISPGWFPQVVLLNGAGMYEKSGTVLRVRPDGTSTLVESIVASATCDLGMRRYPFDRHRLAASFAVLGFAGDEIAFTLPADGAPAVASRATIPQWEIRGATAEVAARNAGPVEASAFTLAIDVARIPFYVMRLIVLPLALIVTMSFSVFWMDRSSLGDRINVSFIGILTAVAYQIVMGDKLPRIAYATVIHGFLSLSFITMCLTVMVNLTVGAMDKRKRFDLGDRVDYACRWLFPLAYFGTLAIGFTIMTLAFDADEGMS
jgi:hypothetical protein